VAGILKRRISINYKLDLYLLFFSSDAESNKSV